MAQQKTEREDMEEHRLSRRVEDTALSWERRSVVGPTPSALGPRRLPHSLPPLTPPPTYPQMIWILWE